VKSRGCLQCDDAGKRGHSKKLFKRRNRLDTRKYVFSNGIVDKWNALPNSCMDCTALNELKSKINLDLKLSWLEQYVSNIKIKRQQS